MACSLTRWSVWSARCSHDGPDAGVNDMAVVGKALEVQDVILDGVYLCSHAGWSAGVYVVLTLGGVQDVLTLGGVQDVLTL